MGANVLVIEDNPANLDLIGYLLGAFGHTVRGALSGEEGLKAAKAERPDLIICDLHLPGMTGYDIARELKSDQVLRSIPIVAVTALAMVGDRERVLAAGFDGYLSKPIDPEKFVEQIDRFLPAVSRASAPILPAEIVAAAPPSTPSHQEGPAILIVDNVDQNLSLLRDLLAGLGLRILTASTVIEAIGLARVAKPDLILSDIHMPRLDGYDLLRLLRADTELSQTPVVFITASVHYEVDEREIKAVGALAVIRRDSDPEQIRTRIIDCLPADAKSSIAASRK
jgi:two-component system cell cycle response regulator